MKKFRFHKVNGFGQTFEDVKARDLDHALRIVAQRYTNTCSASVRKDGPTTFTLFGKAGHNLGKFNLVPE